MIDPRAPLRMPSPGVTNVEEVKSGLRIGFESELKRLDRAEATPERQPGERLSHLHGAIYCNPRPSTKSKLMPMSICCATSNLPAVAAQKLAVSRCLLRERYFSVEQS